MADINLGDIVAHLRLDSQDFTRGFQQAQQQFNQFNQTFNQFNQTFQQFNAQFNQFNQTFNQINTTLNQTNQTFNQTNQTLNQTNQTFNQTHNTLNQTNQTFNTFNTTINNTTNNLNQANRGAQSFGDTWRTLLAVAGGIGLATSLQAIVGSLAHFVAESVRMAAQVQDLVLAFRAIEGTGQAAGQTLSFLFQTAQRVGVDFLTTADSFKRMDQAAKGTQLEGEGVRRVFQGIVEGARALGSSQQQVGNALVALEQILTKGKLSAEEYRRQLGNAIPGALGLMAQGFGVTTQAMERMITSGLIPADAAVIAFGKSMAALGAAAGGEQVDRLSTTFAQLKNETVAWMTAIGEGISTVLKPFLDTLVSISEELRRIFGIRPPGASQRPGANTGSAIVTTLGYGTQPYAPSEFEDPTKDPRFLQSPYTPQILAQAQRAGIDPVLFSRLIGRESRFNPEATGPYVPGQGQAGGLGQVMPRTGADYGLITREDFVNPERNLTASANILRDYRGTLQKVFGNLNDETRLVLAAYNAGIGNVVKAIQSTQAAGQEPTFEAVLSRMSPGARAQTGPYVEFITGEAPLPGTRPGGLAGLLGGNRRAEQEQANQIIASAKAAGLDPIESMLTSMRLLLERLPELQSRIATLQQSGMNFGDQFGKTVTKDAADLQKQFTAQVEALAQLKDLQERMTPAQRERLKLAAEEMALFQQSLLTDDKRRDLLQQQVQQLEQLVIQRRAELILQQQGRDAADRFTREQTTALQERRIGEQGLLGAMTPAQQIATLQQRRAALTPQVTALGAEVEDVAATRQMADAVAQVARHQEQLEKAAIDRLETMRAKLTLTSAAQQELTAAQLAAKFPLNDVIQALAAEIPLLEEEHTTMMATFNAIKMRTDAQREASDHQDKYNEKLEETLALMRTPPDQRVSERLRLQAPGNERTPAQERMLDQIAMQERLNHAAQLLEQLGGSVGSAWASALSSMAQGTVTVAQAFRQMAQSILQSMAQLAAQEGMKTLFSLLGTVVRGALTPTAPPAGGAASGVAFQGGSETAWNASVGAFHFQHGGMVNRPTYALLGEGGAATNPEYVLNRPQMEHLLRAAPSAGGQAMGGSQTVNIINVATQEQAEQTAAERRAMGEAAVINHVVSNMQKGEGSQIVRMMRMMQR